MSVHTVCMRTTSLRTAIFAVMTLLTVAGCAGAGAVPESRPTTVSGPRDSPSAIRGVEQGQADLELWVSNQSFEDDPVTLTVSIDDTQVVASPFTVEGQHNWILFPIKIPPGPHVLDVVSATGVSMQKHFTLPGTGRRYAVIDYWNYPQDGGRQITWLIQSTPIGFA